MCDDVRPILSFETENMSLNSVSKDFTSCASVSERCASLCFEHIKSIGLLIESMTLRIAD